MLGYLSSSIWTSPTQTLVKTVNVEIPLEVLREGLVNAIVHRDYFEEGAGILVEVGALGTSIGILVDN